MTRLNQEKAGIEGPKRFFKLGISMRDMKKMIEYIIVEDKI